MDGHGRQRVAMEYLRRMSMGLVLYLYFLMEAYLWEDYIKQGGGVGLLRQNLSQIDARGMSIHWVPGSTSVCPWICLLISSMDVHRWYHRIGMNSR